MKRILINLVKIIVSLGLIGYILLVQVDLAQLWTLFRSLRLAPLVLGFLLMIGGVFLRAFRWQVLLNSLNIRISLWELSHYYFVGSFFNMFLPTGFGGDAVKMGKLAQATGQVPESIGTTLVERATGLWVLFVLALLALPFSLKLLPLGWVPWILLITLLGVVGGWVLMATPFLPWLGNKIRLPGQASLERFYRSVSRLGWTALGKACLISLVFDLILIWMIGLLGASLNLNLPVGSLFLFTPLISFSLTLPVSIGGLGVREQTFILLFQSVGVTAAAATVMSLLYYLLTTVLPGLIGGGWYILQNARSARISGEAPVARIDEGS
jgi:uncharacterized membrane protein YbhN (UPF0104 family)